MTCELYMLLFCVCVFLGFEWFVRFSYPLVYVDGRKYFTNVIAATCNMTLTILDFPQCVFKLLMQGRRNRNTDGIDQMTCCEPHHAASRQNYKTKLTFLAVAIWGIQLHRQATTLSASTFTLNIVTIGYFKNSICAIYFWTHVSYSLH